MYLIGIDDTDVRGSPGTGHLARDLAAWLGEHLCLLGVTRHQLLQDPRIEMTSKNSAAAIHLQTDGKIDTAWLVEETARRVRAAAAPGSDPGICVAREVPQAVVAFGRRAKASLVTAEEAQALAAQSNLVLQGLGGSGAGVVGALAAVGLAASGNDGRFTLYGRLRELSGLQPVSAIIAAGAKRVQAVTGEVVTEGLVDTQGKLRPSLADGLPVLWVERRDGGWTAVHRG